jgi:predicted kinase
MMVMATLHFICGAAGAGKTTYAIALAKRAKTVRLTIDEWMGNLFAADAIEPSPAAWTRERLARCEAQMWALADELVTRDVSVVFDMDLSRQDQRDRFRARASQTRAEIKLHYLDVDRETRRARVLGRTTGAMTEAAFDSLDRSFEAPTEDELYGAMIVSDGET